MIRYMLTLIFVGLLLTGWACGRGTDNIDRQTVQTFDLSRFLGEWYEIARYDHRFERNMEEVRAIYRLKENGRIEVINSGLDPKTGTRKTAIGKAHTTDQPGRLKVSFFWIFYSDYNILALGEAYDWALIGSRSADYLWILARTPQLPAATLDHILQLARERGYDTSRLIFVRQTSAPVQPAGTPASATRTDAPDHRP